jgi:hypothetical protein
MLTKTDSTALIIGEVHCDDSVVNWLNYNLNELHARGYHCFAFEYNADYNIDKMIEIAQRDIKHIKENLSIDIESYVKEITIVTLKKLLEKIASSNDSEEQLIQKLVQNMGKEQASNILDQISDQSNQAKQTYANSKMLRQVTESRLELWKKIKDLKMDFVNIDLNLKRDESLPKITEKLLDERDRVMSDKLVELINQYSGMVIFLGGVNHIPGLAKNLLDTNTISSENKNFLFLRNRLPIKTNEKEEGIAEKNKKLTSTYPSYNLYTLDHEKKDLLSVFAVEKTTCTEEETFLANYRKTISVDNMGHLFRLWAAGSVKEDDLGKKILSKTPDVLNSYGQSGKTALDFAKEKNNSSTLEKLGIWKAKSGTEVKPSFQQQSNVNHQNTKKL